uniref:Uncharacterized protein n=1 Tax=Solanum lycopersicum TaxID=4081 RepID=A0A3Q7G485_SOLLC
MDIPKISNDTDLLHPSTELEKQKHKIVRFVQSPNFTFENVKCQVLLITTISKHSQTVVTCPIC